ncbi:MAG TPA: class I SAM-dependent methyltransferase [Gaiellaceae bacterium]|nr:class I SAM-dependent methyltransferase [Gaiellaceae bacterium]
MDGLYERQKRYYDLRALEYDATSWDFEDPETDEIAALVASLSPVRTLDIGCGTGYLSQFHRGEVTLLDASEQMLAIASARVPAAAVVHGDALPLPFEDASFDRVFSSHFYGHLRPAERKRFLAEARRVASELVLVEQNVGHREGLNSERSRTGASTTSTRSTSAPTRCSRSSATRSSFTRARTSSSAFRPSAAR